MECGSRMKFPEGGIEKVRGLNREVPEISASTYSRIDRLGF